MKRKLVMGLVAAGLFLAGFGGAVLPASADPHHFLLKLANGTSVPWTGEPGSAPSTITVAGVGGGRARARGAQAGADHDDDDQAVERAAEAVRAAEPVAVEVHAADHDRQAEGEEERVRLTGADRRQAEPAGDHRAQVLEGSSFG